MVNLCDELIIYRNFESQILKEQKLNELLNADLENDPRQVDACLTVIELEEYSELSPLLRKLLIKVSVLADRSHVERLMDEYRVDGNVSRLLRCSDLLVARPELGSPEWLGFLLEIIRTSKEKQKIRAHFLSRVVESWSSHYSSENLKYLCDWAVELANPPGYGVVRACLPWMRNAGAEEVQNLLTGLDSEKSGRRLNVCATLLTQCSHTRTVGVFERALDIFYEMSMSPEFNAHRNENEHWRCDFSSSRYELVQILLNWSFQAESHHVPVLMDLLENESTPVNRLHLSILLGRLSQWGNEPLLRRYLSDLIKPMTDGWDHDPFEWRIKNYLPWLEWAAQETLDWFSEQLSIQADFAAKIVMHSFLDLCRTELPSFKINR